MNAKPNLARWLLALAAGVPAIVGAAPCYTVVDRNDAVVYRATDPPFALAGPEYADGMRRLRGAGQQLFWFEPTICFEELATQSGPKAVGSDAGAIIQARRTVSRSDTGAGAPGSGTSAVRPSAAPARPASRPAGKY